MTVHIHTNKKRRRVRDSLLWIRQGAEWTATGVDADGDIAHLSIRPYGGGWCLFIDGYKIAGPYPTAEQAKRLCRTYKRANAE